MKQLLISEGAARLIGSLRTGNGLLEAKAYIADAMDAAVCQLAGCDTVDRTDLLPLVALSRYYGLLVSLAGQDDETPP